MDLFKLFARIVLDTKEYEEGLDKAEGSAKSFAERAGGVFQKAAGAVGTIAKAGAAGIAAGSAAVGVLAKQAVGAYGEYEQLSGGVKKLFGDAYDTVMKNASEAYRTVGISANEYMEQATSFSASLINSLGGDTQKAAELADVALQAMSDNVNTFGSDMASVQNAFQGFAKGYYTMLDNLKLGYGGTKTEMERLIEDADRLSEAFSAQRDENGKVTMSFSDIIQAIQIIQEKQNIAGTTSKEAATTIEGSLNMVKAAWENLVAGFANPDADMGKLMDNLIVSIVGENEGEGLLNRIIPTIERAMEGIGKFVSKAAPIIAKYLPGLVESILPGLLSAGTSLVAGLAQSLPTIAKVLIDQIPVIFNTLKESFSESGDAIDAGIEFIRNVGKGLVEGIPEFLSNALPVLVEFTGKLRENAGKLIDIGLEFIRNLVTGIINSIPLLIENIPQIVINIANIINDNAPKILSTGIMLIGQLALGLIQAIPVLIANLPKIIEAIWAVFTAVNWINLGANIITFIKNGITSLAKAIPEALKNIGKSAIEFLKGLDWPTLGTNIIQFIVQGITTLITAIPNALLSIGKTAIDAILSIDWLSIGANIIKGIANGVANNAGLVIDAIKNMAKNAFNAAVNFFKIGSPSKLFRQEVGRRLPEGTALGIEDNSKMVTRAIDDLDREIEVPTMTVKRPQESAMDVLSMPGPLQTAARNVTVILQLDRTQLGKAVFQLNNEETQRLGLQIGEEAWSGA